MLEMKTLKVAQGFSVYSNHHKSGIFHCLQIVDCISGIASKSPLVKSKGCARIEGTQQRKWTQT